MRAVCTILLLLSIALLIGVEHLRGEKAALIAQLTREQDLARVRSGELADTQHRLAQCASNLRMSAVSVDELRRHGGVVQSADAWVELLCRPATDRQFDPNSPITLATEIEFGTGSGIYTFVTRRLEPLAVAMDDSEHIRLTLSYEPLHNDEVAGRPIEDMAAIRMLHTHYNDVLHAVGLQLYPDGIRTLVFNINGLEAARVAGFHSDRDPPGDERWDVSASFSNLPAAYSRALEERIASRTAAEPAATSTP